MFVIFSGGIAKIEGLEELSGEAWVRLTPFSSEACDGILLPRKTQPTSAG